MKKCTSVEEVVAAVKKEGCVEISSGLYLLTKAEVESDLTDQDSDDTISLVKRARKDSIFVQDTAGFLEVVDTEDIAELL